MIGKITRIVITVAILVLAVWASIAALFGGAGDSISAHVRDYCSQYPILAVAAGVLIGHWFWGMGPAVRRDS
jgi:hypothetical protein